MADLLPETEGPPLARERAPVAGARARRRAVNASPGAASAAPASSWSRSQGLVIPIALLEPSGVDADSQHPETPGAGEMAVFDDLGLDGASTGGGGQRERRTRPERLPARAGWRDAERYADDRGGLVSFAAIDSRGRLRGHDEDRLFSSASVVKAMVLAAELRRLADEGAEVDSGTDSLLSAMITASDNEAADAVYARVGDAGLHEVAKRAGMTGFTVAGYWGNAQITAADMARFFGDLDHMLPQALSASTGWGCWAR